MLHSQKELDEIYQDIKSADFNKAIDAARRMTPSGLVVHSEISNPDPDGTVFLSVPIRNGTDRTVYKRPPGGFWVEAVDPDPLTFLAADTRSEAMKTRQEGFRLIRQDCPDADPDTIVECIQAAFTQLNNNPRAVVSPQAIYDLCVKSK
ncbi:MAG: hypothetical protein PHX60_13435 [Giesbergeria sp.]|uniref:hypothetical protein n=1 Tax=Giesbergeria sp. TaxID=2818473 RepID=UPI00262D5F67|nr:hypothetical protein [Giesbergeria sp.]MDD2610662.1 hypothetical protein [Giesbergeria sp.]